MHYADLDFRVRALEPARLPAFRGTTLRGAFGYALKRTVCVVAHRDCGRCLLRNRCAFPSVFEGRPPDDRRFMRKYPHVPQPFVLRVPAHSPTLVNAGEEFTFGIRLFGPAIEFYPYVVYGVMRMGERGLGRDRARFEMSGVSDGDQEILDGADLHSPVPRQVFNGVNPAATTCEQMSIRLVTPLRLKTDGQFNPSPSMSDLIRSAVRRVRILSHFYGDHEIIPDDMAALMASAEAARLTHRETRWFEIKRRSKRENVDMSLAGALGQLVFELRDSHVLPWLRAAEVCHLGKACSFGYGRIKLNGEVA